MLESPIGFNGSQIAGAVALGTESESKGPEVESDTKDDASAGGQPFYTVNIPFADSLGVSLLPTSVLPDGKALYSKALAPGDANGFSPAITTETGALILPAEGKTSIVLESIHPCVSTARVCA